MSRRFLILIFLIVLGCSAKDPLKPVVKQQFIMPLKVGNSWRYRTDYNYTNTLYNYSYHQFGGLTREVINEVMVDDEKWYRILESYFDTSIYTDEYAADTYYYDGEDTYYFTNRLDGLYHINDISDSARRVAKFPASAGELYIYDGGSYTIQTEVVSVNEEIIVEGEIYNCYHYLEVFKHQSTIYADTVHLYYQPHVGMILYWSEDWYDGEYSSQEVKLTGYDLK